MDLKVVKFLLILALLLCLLKMPFGYYQFFRIFGTIGFAYLSYQTYKENDKMWLIIFGSFAVLFNPIKPVLFNREIWRILDAAIAVSIALNIIITNNMEKENKKEITTSEK